MKWVTVGDSDKIGCFNVDQIQSFYWYNGSLSVQVKGEPTSHTFHDPVKYLFGQLCDGIKVRRDYT